MFFPFQLVVQCNSEVSDDFLRLNFCISQYKLWFANFLSVLPGVDHEVRLLQIDKLVWPLPLWCGLHTCAKCFYGCSKY